MKLSMLSCEVDGSISYKIRQDRLGKLKKIITSDIKVLDVGGRPSFWKRLNIPTDNIVMVNIESIPGCIKGDGRALSRLITDTFDLIVSFSTIEHVGGFVDQIMFANEIMNAGEEYIIQTPYKHFPIEPHVQLPLFQYLPWDIKRKIFTKFNIGYYQKDDDINLLRNIRLLTRKELGYLFPDGHILSERVFGMPQSLVITNGSRYD